MVGTDRDRQKLTLAPRLERVDHPQGQHVVAIAADIRIEDQADGLGGAGWGGSRSMAIATARKAILRITFTMTFAPTSRSLILQQPRVFHGAVLGLALHIAIPATMRPVAGPVSSLVYS